MGPVSATPVSELPFELFLVIAAHLPLPYRPSSLLSLALTCHRLYEVVIPSLLYNAVRVVGEEQALRTLNTLIAKAAPVNEEDIQKKGSFSLSHCIHHLCIQSSITTPIRPPDNSISALHKLIDVEGLQHLSDLTLHIDPEWDGTSTPNPINVNFTLPSLFLESLRKKCPNLKNVYLSYDISQEFENKWIERELFSIKSLTSIRVRGMLHDYPIPTVNFLQLPPNLHTLELRLWDHIRGRGVDASGPGGLFNCVIPNLNTLILDDFTVSDPTSSNIFWRAHPGIKRLELGPDVSGSWFDNFEVGMLPNLSHLKCNIDYALVLVPVASKMLIRLSLLHTYNSQGPYLLRAAVPEGVLLALRSLSIDRDSGNSPKPRKGHRWREDENGNVLQVNAKKPARREFDGNYIMSISKAAPNLEELELMGTSDDTLDSITASLSRFPKLQRLTLSGAVRPAYPPFFERSYFWTDFTEFNGLADVQVLPGRSFGKYAPESFDEAARDLANGCRTLAVVTMGRKLGDLFIYIGPSARIIRECEGGLVKEVKRIQAWGNIIGKEWEW